MKQHNIHQTLLNIIFHHVQQTDEIAELMAEEEANRIKLPEILSNYSLNTSAGKRNHSSSSDNIVRHYDFEEVLQTIETMESLSIQRSVNLRWLCFVEESFVICQIIIVCCTSMSLSVLYRVRFMNPSINLSIIEK